MVRLSEDLAKQLVELAGVPIPRGRSAATPGEAAEVAAELGGEVVVKALVRAGRRGKAGAVTFASTSAEAAACAGALLGHHVLDLPVERVYVEQRITAAQELFLSITFDPTTRGPIALVSRRGGVEIEELVTASPELLVSEPIDYGRGLSVWGATDLWERAGVSGAPLMPVARLTAACYRAFTGYDAALLEINPIIVTPGGAAVAAAAMLDVDEAAIGRQSLLAGHDAGGARSERERAVEEANRGVRASGSVRYLELEGGDLGLCVAGGGGGLYQFDLLLRAGARPANYSDISPGELGEKLRALLRAAIGKPGVRGLLFSINIMQLGQVDVYTRALVDVLRELRIDPERFPIVARLAGLREAEGAAVLEAVPGVRFHTDDVTLDGAVAEIAGLMCDDAAAAPALRPVENPVAETEALSRPHGIGGEA